MPENTESRPSYSPSIDFLYSEDTRCPRVLYRTTREGGDDASPVMEVETFGFNDAEFLLRNEVLPRAGMSYERWLDKDRELHSWHIALNPELDEDSRKLLKRIFEKLPREERQRIQNHLRDSIPLLHLGGEEVTMDLPQGSEIVINDDYVLLREGEDEHILETDYEEETVEIFLDAWHLFPPDIAVRLAGIEVAVGIEFGELRANAMLEELTEQAQSGSLTEKNVRLLINPYIHFLEAE